MELNNCITDVPGVKAGHFTDKDKGTGVTVLIFEKGAVGGVDVRGMASGSRELLALDPLHVTSRCHAICLSGGSAFGLAAADGVMQFLAERNIGYLARVAVVPIVPAAIIFDLSFKSMEGRPGKEEGYKACMAADDKPIAQGSAGAGTGATVGKLLGIENAMKGGIGCASASIRSGAVVAALAVVNNLGDVLDHKTGAIIAGTRDPGTGRFLDTARALSELPPAPFNTGPGENTNLVVVATDAALDKAAANKLARMASAGMARVLSPAHSTFDGDIVFAVSTGDKPGEVNALGALAARLTAEAINRAVLEADGLGILPAARDLSPR